MILECGYDETLDGWREPLHVSGLSSAFGQTAALFRDRDVTQVLVLSFNDSRKLKACSGGIKTRSQQYERSLLRSDFWRKNYAPAS